MSWNGTAAKSAIADRSARRGQQRAWQRAIAVWILVFCGLLAWRSDYLTRPPYEDLAWLWQEANFLAEHDFDYYRLWTEEPRADQVVGGGRSYLISILPTFLAVLMKVFAASEQVFVAYHLVYLACGSAVATMVFWTLRKSTGSLAAALTVMAVLTTPAFSVRLEQLGMDLPMATAALGSGLLMWRERYFGAAIVSLLAFLLKPTGAIMTAANLSFLVIALWAATESGSQKKRRWWGTVAHGGVLAIEVALIAVSGMMQIDRRWSPPSQVSVPRLRSAPYWVPDVMVVLAIGVICSLLALAWLLASTRRGEQQVTGWWRRLAERLVSNYGVITLSWIVIGGSLLAMTKVLFMPRYLTLSIPFLYLILGMLLFVWRPARFAGFVLMGLVVVINTVNAHGRLFPSLVEVHGPEFRRTNLFSPRASIALERSLEYRRDHESTIRALRLLETHFADAPIFTDDTYYVYLTMPRLGYVRRALRAYRISDYAAAVEQYLQCSKPGDEPRPVFLVGGLSGFMVAGPDAGDEILYDDGEAIPLIAFRRRWPDGVPDEATRERWYFERLCPGGALQQPTAAAALAQRRLERGDLPRARRTLEMGLELFPGCRQLLLLSADIAIREAQWGKAEWFCDRALRLDPMDHEAWAHLASVWAVRPVLEIVNSATVEQETNLVSTLKQAANALQYGQPKQALVVTATTKKPDANTPEGRAPHQNPIDATEDKAPHEEVDNGPHAVAQPIRYEVMRRMVRAAALWRLGQLEAAVEELKEIVRLDSGQAVARSLLAVWAMQQGQAERIEEHLARIESDERLMARCHVLAGMMRLQRGQLNAADSHLKRALVADPQSVAARYYAGLLRLANGEIEQAVRHLQIARTLAPEFSDAANTLGVLWARTAQLERARVCFEEAVRANANNETARRNLMALLRTDSKLVQRDGR